MNKDTLLIKTDKDVKMIFDPLRLKIINTLAYNNEEMTVKQIATEMEEAPNKVHYHVKKLFDFGALKLVRTENINGIIAKYYYLAYVNYILDNKSSDTKKLLVHNNPLYGMLDDATNRFRKGIATFAKNSVEFGEARGPAGISSCKLYMTRDEQSQFVDDLSKLMLKYSVRDDSKLVFTTINGIVRIK